MLALSFHFLAGRYHATPWDQHVNVGAVAWPPEPWRIARALIATWHHKIKHLGRHQEDTLAGLIESLAQELPEYHLPAASHSHTRHYMPQFKADDSKLIFDAFVAVKRDDPLIVIWDELSLQDDQNDLLDDLLSAIGYLGRAESWVEARRLNDPQEITANCTPFNPETDDADSGEIITLHAASAREEYKNLRTGFLEEKKVSKKMKKTLPESLLDALSVATSDLRTQGWSQPPAARKVNYLRPNNALTPKPTVPQYQPQKATSVQFILIGKPLPQVEDSLRIGELVRWAVMRKAEYILGKDNIPAIFSGHDMPEGNRHKHAFYLPWDSDGDGRIDRVLLHVPAGMDGKERRAIERINRIYDRGMEWRLVLESIGGKDVAGDIAQESAVWESNTPYLHPWHSKKKFSVQDQLRRECRERGLPEPDCKQLDEIQVGTRKRRPIHFRRFRSKRGLHQPDHMGSFWKITFPKPVAGPIALGFGCHFGLGLFNKPPKEKK